MAPYKRLINKLISLFEEERYDRKEKFVQRLQGLTESPFFGPIPGMTARQEVVATSTTLGQLYVVSESRQL